MDEFSSYCFILGDFFVADKSPCRFDNEMTLKEDYDYTCSHIETHGSVLRCNRLMIHAKHRSNPGGAVASRDVGGAKERKNIAILQRKWPGVFKLNCLRKGWEVRMTWSTRGKEQAGSSGQIMKAKKGKAVSARSTKSAGAKRFGREFPPTAVLQYTKKVSKSEYITKRCKRCNNRTVQQCLGVSFVDGNGAERKYGLTDLRYDIEGGRLQIIKSK